MASGSYDGKAGLTPDGAKPFSFTPNVNRMKTKRWAEAKKISYDGDDWGDDEYGEYDHDEEEEIPPPPVNPALLSGQPNTTSGPTSSAPIRPSPDRSVTTDTVGSIERPSFANRSQTTDVTSGSGPATGRPVPFVRPADIYKRMREERQRQAAAHGSSSSSESPRLPTADSRIDARQSPKAPEQPKGLPEQSNTVEDEGKPRLPDIKRLSTFGASFLGSNQGLSQSPVQEPQRKDLGSPVNLEDPQNPSLQHNPSLGFRSAVNQAFDVPETPSTTVESLERSDSGSTSVLSPIISSRGPDEVKTPTITEEPSDLADRTPVFKPGHRRDLSLPSSDNSPSRKPEIHDGDLVAQSKMVEVSSVSPSDALRDGFGHSDTEPARRAQGSSEHDLPLPLRFNNSTSSNAQLSTNNLPAIVPPLSTETSPQDTESDRLRKEIILSLSRENSPGRESGPQDFQEAVNGSTLTPHDYSTHWANQPERATDSLVDQNPFTGGDSSPVAPANLPSTEVDSPVEVTQPKRSRRFSWEESSDSDISEPENLNNLLHQPEVTLQPSQVSTEDVLEADKPIRGLEDDIQPESERYQRPVSDDGFETEPWNDLPVGPPATGEGVASPGTPDQDSVAARQVQFASSIDQPLLGFREILGIKSSQERIRAFDRTRYQFASIDTGIGDWIEATILAHPEYSEIVEETQQLPIANQKQLPSKAKFPKLASLGNLTSHLDGPGSLKRPSAQLGSQRGKDLFHTAGLLGGKAGGAARGLFEKGRSKFRGGGTDKVCQSVSGRRKSLPHPEVSSSSTEDKDIAVFYGNNPLLRTSIDLATLPEINPGNVEVLTGVDPNETLDEKTYSKVAENKQTSVANGFSATIEGEKGVEAMILSLANFQAPPVQSEYIVLSVPNVNTTREQQPLSSVDTTACPQEISSQANGDNDPFSSSFDFEQELVAALRLDGTDSLSQGLMSRGLLSGSNDNNNNRLSLAMFSCHNSPDVSDVEVSTKSSSTLEGGQEGEDHAPSGHFDEVDVKKEEEKPRSRSDDDISRVVNNPDHSSVPEDATKAENIEEHGDIESHRALGKQGGSVHSQANESPRNLDDSGKHESPEKPDFSDGRTSSEVLQGHNDSERNGDSDNSSRPKGSHSEGEGNLDLDSNGDSEDQVDSPSVSVDVKVAEFTVVKPVRDTRVNLLVNGQPVDSFHPEVDGNQPSAPGISKEDKERGTVDGEEKTGKVVESRQQDSEDTLTLSGATRKADTTTAEDPESHRRAEEQNSNVEAEKPGSDVSQDTSLPGTGQNSNSTSGSETEKSQPSSARSSQKHTGAPIIPLPTENRSPFPKKQQAVRDRRLPGDRRRSSESASSTPFKMPQSRFYRAPVQSPAEQSGRPRGSTIQAMSPQISSSSSSSSPPQPNGAAVGSQNQHSQPSQGLVERNSSDVGKGMMQTVSTDAASSKQSPRPSMQSSEQISVLRNSHTESASSQSESGEGRQSPLRGGEGVSSAGKDPAPSISTLSPGGPDSQKSFDSGRTTPAAPEITSFPKPKHPPPPPPRPTPTPSTPEQGSILPQRTQSPVERWKKFIPHKLSIPQKGTFNKLSGFFRRPAGRDQEKGKAPMRPDTDSQSPMPRISMSRPGSSPTSPFWFSPDDKYNPNHYKGEGSPGSSNPFRGMPPPTGGYYAPTSTPSSANLPSTTNPSIPLSGSRLGGPQQPVSDKVLEAILESSSPVSRSPPRSYHRASSGESPYQKSSTSPSLYQQAASSSQARFSTPQQSSASSLSEQISRSNSSEQHTSTNTPRASSISSGPNRAAAAAATTITPTTPTSIRTGENNRERSVSTSEYHPLRGEARAINLSSEPVELPISADDSSEEIVMTSTAYPGQEWKPSGFSSWEQF